MMTSLALTGYELAEVNAVLNTHLPPEIRAGVIGSRARGNPKPWSDLDLVLEGPAPLPLSLLAALAEAFDESSLPWKVDIIDRGAVSADFRKIIDTTIVTLPRS